MELRHLYTISEIIKNEITKGSLTQDITKDVEIVIKFPPSTYYAIDKEFYYLTHNNSYEGFVHSKDEIDAKVNGIQFKLLPKSTAETA